MWNFIINAVLTMAIAVLAYSAGRSDGSRRRLRELDEAWGRMKVEAGPVEGP